MRRWKVAYIVAVFLVGVASVYPGDESAAIAAGHWVLAIMTYPLGSLASAAGFLLLYLGFLTPVEAAVIVTPLFAVLGYMQWRRLIPALYRRGR